MVLVLRWLFGVGGVGTGAKERIRKEITVYLCLIIST